MTDEHYRIINRALMYLEDDDEAQAEWREKARTALHHIFGREKRLREENENLREAHGPGKCVRQARPEVLLERDDALKETT